MNQLVGLDFGKKSKHMAEPQSDHVQLLSFVSAQRPAAWRYGQDSYKL